MSIDLQRFCTNLDDPRYFLSKPWKNKDGRIMASNGHVAVLMDPGFESPVQLEMLENKPGQKICEWAQEIPTSGFVPVPQDFAPDPACTHCDRTPDPDDEDQCYWCDGTGFNKKQSVKIGKVPFAKHYLRLIASLPNCQIKTRGPTESACFKFDGGIGFLMPTRS